MLSLELAKQFVLNGLALSFGESVFHFEAYKDKIFINSRGIELTAYVFCAFDCDVLEAIVGGNFFLGGVGLLMTIFDYNH